MQTDNQQIPIATIGEVEIGILRGVFSTLNYLPSSCSMSCCKYNNNGSAENTGRNRDCGYVSIEVCSQWN